MNPPDPCCPAALYEIPAQIVCTCGHAQHYHSMNHPHVCVWTKFVNSAMGDCDCIGFSDRSPWKNALEEAQGP